MRPIAVCSHMRSGTHLTIDLLRRNAPEIPVGYLSLDRLIPGHEKALSLRALEAELSRQGPIPLLKTHAPAAPGWFPAEDPRSAHAHALLGAARVVYVMRDGRDVMVSLFHYMRRYSARVRAQSFESFLRDRDDFFQTCPTFQGLDRVSAWARHVEGWLDQPDVVVVRYEDLLVRLEPTLRDVLARLGLDAASPITPMPVPAGVRRRVLRRLLAPFAPRRASTAVAPRRGVIGDASRYFSASDERFFRERSGSVLERLTAPKAS